MNSITLDIRMSEKLKNYIVENEMKEGDKLPSERELSELFGVQRTTMRAALKRLINENIICAIKNKGNYVCESKIKRNLLEFASMTKTIQQSGNEISTQVIFVELIECNKKVSKELKIALGSKVYKIKRLRIVNDKPLAIETSYIGEEFVPDIDKCDLEKRSLYEVIEHEYGIKLVNAVQQISMVFADEDESRLLNIDEGEAVLMLSSVALDQKDREIEYSESLTRGDRCIFTSRLTKKGY